ncbi:MAG: SBBP repeat-containing protein, partial [Bacteroidia bacterium]|nr:SBBP repeat-containing protein [Bacteroidia bacterium]
TFGNIDESIPLSFQLDNNNNQQKILSKFKQHTTNTFGINIADYDKTKTLIIDPLPWATYFGGNSSDMGLSITKDAIGNIITTGNTSSSSNIATSGSYQTTLGGNSDVFIAKFNNSGTLQWSTFYGDIGGEDGDGIVTDNSNNLYLVGSTTSSSGISTTGAYQTTYGGGTGVGDVFIAKFNASGYRLWGTYFGGTGDDGAYYSISLDTSSNILICGLTNSTSGIASQGSNQSIYGGGYFDAFLAKFSSSGAIIWASYFGGSMDESAYGITTDRLNNIYITGNTSSTGLATLGAFQYTYGGGANDVFLTKYNSFGAIQWSTYFGGNGNDAGLSIACDTSNNILICGQTNSSSGISTTGTFQMAYAGSGSLLNGFIAKFSTTGSRIWGTYYGTSLGSETASAISIDANNNVIIVGNTESTSGLSTIGAFQTISGGGVDAYIAKFNDSGNRVWGTYFGGGSIDSGKNLVIDSNNNIYIIGYTSSSLGIATTNAYQTSRGGSNDAFVALFSNSGSLPVKLISFNAKDVNNHVLCSWSTASELNNNYFSIERSLDSEHFENIGAVNGKGYSINTIKYSFIDNNPFKGISYYRLKQVDFNGNFEYSKIVSVNFENTNPNIELYPNPTTGEIIINSNSLQNYISIYNFKGTIILSSIESSNRFKIDLKNFNAGMYFIRVNEKVMKFIKID